MDEAPRAIWQPGQEALRRQQSPWMVAHVNAGGAYVLLRVRCTTVWNASEPPQAQLSAQSRHGSIAGSTFATRLARALADDGSPADQLDLEATFSVTNVNSSLVLRPIILSIGARGNLLQQGQLHRLALRVLEDWRTEAAWPSDTPVALTATVMATVDPATQANTIDNVVPHEACAKPRAASSSGDAGRAPRLRRLTARVGLATIFGLAAIGLAQVGGWVRAPVLQQPAAISLRAETIGPVKQESSGPLPSATMAATPTPDAGPRTLLDVTPDGGSQLAWPNDPLSTAWFAADGYHLFARQPSQFVAVATPTDQTLRDVIVTAAFKKVAGPPGGGYGIIVRDQQTESRDGLNQGGNYYLLEVGDRAEVALWRRDGDHWLDLATWTPSSAVHSDTAENVVSARAIGQQLTLAVNGAVVASATDAALVGGGVGVFLGGDLNHAVLTRLKIEAID